MAVKHWLKGAPVDTLKKEQTYVVEFWATWCKPCMESVPHLTALARANPDVTFVGVSIWEDDDGNRLKEFVAHMGDRMDYHVGYSGNKEGMARTWMDASAQDGIPTAFVVKAGNVQWIGDPMDLERPLAEIKAGTFDLKAHLVAFMKRAEKSRRKSASRDALKSAKDRFDAGDRSGAVTALAKAVTEYPEDASAAKAVRFDWLAVQAPKAWFAKARKMAKSGHKEELQALCDYALSRANEQNRVKTVKRAMVLALQATHYKDLDVLFYGFNVYYAIPDRRDDLDMTCRILALLPKGPLKDNATLRNTVLKRKAELEAKSSA